MLSGFWRQGGSSGAYRRLWGRSQLVMGLALAWQASRAEIVASLRHV